MYIGYLHINYFQIIGYWLSFCLYYTDMSNIRLKELAEKLNLSISTVSKALNNSHEISEETKKRVKKLALQYNYRPNLLAKSLKTGRSNTIGLIVPYITNPFQSQVLEGAQKAAIESNFNLIFMQSRENALLEDESLKAMLQQNIDGILISPSANSNVRYLKEINSQVPLVLMDRIDFDINTHKVGVNSEKGAFQATQHLINSGLKDILVVMGKNIGVSQRRLAGYKKALLANYLEYNPDNVIYVEYGQNSKDLIKNLSIILDRKLAEFNHPIGLFGTTDTLTVHSLGILSNLGIKVPDQVSIIGFANTEYVDALNPSLSSVVQPAIEIGYLSVKKLIELIHSNNRAEEKFETIVLDPEIIPRKSTQIAQASS